MKITRLYCIEQMYILFKKISVEIEFVNFNPEITMSHTNLSTYWLHKVEELNYLAFKSVLDTIFLRLNIPSGYFYTPIELVRRFPKAISLKART